MPVTAPATTNLRTRAIAPVLRGHGLAPWVGGRSRKDLGVTEHGGYLLPGTDLSAVDAIVAELGWTGLTAHVEGADPRRKRMGDAFVVWFRVPR